MTGSTLGDLSHSFLSRQRNIAIRQDISRYTHELSTGQVSDIRQVLSGNHSYLTDIEHKLELLQGYSVTTTEAAHLSSATQQALGAVSTIAQDLTNGLITSTLTVVGATNGNMASEAKTALNDMIGRVNTQVAGRFLFSGNATDQRPLNDSDSLLTAALAAMAGATTLGDMMSAASNWFDDPAGFATVMYQGSSEAMSPMKLSQTDSVSIDLRATDSEFREILKLTTLTALADDPTFALTTEQKAQLFATAADDMLVAQDSIIKLQAQVGTAEARIDKIATRNAAEKSSLSIAKADLLGVDPYEAATRLEEVQFQLQSLYSVISRNAQLSLVNFI